MLLTAQLFSLFAFLDYLVFFSIWLFCRYLRLLECYSSITRVTVTRVTITRVTLFSLLYSVTRVTLFPLLYSKFRVTLFVTRAQLCMYVTRQLEYKYFDPIYFTYKGGRMPRLDTYWLWAKSDENWQNGEHFIFLRYSSYLTL